MHAKQYTKTLVGAFLISALLLVGWGQAADYVVNGGGTTIWPDDPPAFATGDNVTVNNATIWQINGDASGQTIATLSLGTPASSGTGTLDITAAGKLTTDALVLGSDNDGLINLADGATFTVNNSIDFNQGTVTNNLSSALDWSGKTINWYNSSAIIFGGTGNISLGVHASGETLQLDGGTLVTSGDVDASNFTFNGGNLRVLGELTYAGQLGAGSGIDVFIGGTWTTGQDQGQGNISVNGGEWTLNASQDFATGGGTFIMTSGVVDLNDYNLTLGDVSNVTGGKFISGTLGGSTLSFNTGTLRAAYDTFFTEFSVDNANLTLSGNAVLEIYDSGSDPYTVAYDFSLSDTATITGGADMLLYVQAGANITTTGGTNTTDFEFMGRSVDPVIINSQATFEGAISIADVYDDTTKKNEIINGVFDGEVAIQNWSNSTAYTVGSGYTEISGGTFNDAVGISVLAAGGVTTAKAIISGGIFNAPVSVNEAFTDDQWPSLYYSWGDGAVTFEGGTFNDSVSIAGAGSVTVTAGTFNDSVSLTGAGNVAISGGTFNGALQFAMLGDMSITGGSFDSLEVIDYYEEMGTLNIDGDINVSGADGVFIEGATLNIAAGNTLSLTNASATLLMQPSAYTAGGTLTGAGAISGNVVLESGLITGTLTINGNLTQTGGTIAPGNSIGTMNITGDLALADATIEVGDAPTSDQIVVGGQTTLTDGGTMTVTPLDSSIKFKAGDQYTVVQSAGGFVDSGGYTVSSGVAGFSALGAIDGTNYVVTLDRAIRSFPAGAYNANHVVTYLYDIYDAGEDHPQVMAAIQSDSNQQLAAEKVSGESQATGMQSVMNTGMIRLNTLNQQIRPNRSLQLFNSRLGDNQNATVRGQFDPHAEFERTNVWYAGYGMGGHIVGNENTSPTVVSFSGMMVGIEGIFDAGSRKIGVFYDRSHVATDVAQLGGKSDVNTNYFGGYLTRELEDGYRLFTLGFGEDRYRSRRILDIGTGNDTLNEVANAGYHGWQSSFYTERGYDLQGDYSALQPYVGLQYSYLRQQAFNETDATYARLDFEATDYDSLRFYLGTRVDLPFLEIGHDRKTGQPLGGFVQLQTAWIHEMLDRTAPICNAQLGASSLANNFIVDGADCGRDWWLGSVGTRWRLAKSFSLYGDYTILVNGVQTFHTGSGGLCLSW